MSSEVPATSHHSESRGLYDEARLASFPAATGISSARMSAITRVAGAISMTGATVWSVRDYPGLGLPSTYTLVYPPVCAEDIAAIRTLLTTVSEYAAVPLP